MMNSSPFFFFIKERQVEKCAYIYEPLLSQAGISSTMATHKGPTKVENKATFSIVK